MSEHAAPSCVTNAASGAWLTINTLLCIPPVFFLAVLVKNRAYHRKRLAEADNAVLSSMYYVLVWAVVLLSLVRGALLVSFRNPEAFDKIVWLACRAAFTFVEISVVALLIYGPWLRRTSKEALELAIRASAIGAALDTAIEAALVFAAGVGRVLDGHAVGSRWVAFWVARSMLFSAAYAVLLLLPHTRLRNRAPTKPEFRRYCALLLAYQILSAMLYSLIENGARIAVCMLREVHLAYFAVYGILVYHTFLYDTLKPGQAPRLYTEMMRDSEDAESACGSASATYVSDDDALGAREHPDAVHADDAINVLPQFLSDDDEPTRRSLDQDQSARVPEPSEHDRVVHALAEILSEAEPAPLPSDRTAGKSM